MGKCFTYNNPVIRGFHPDPSVCRANGKYYLVCSSFQYFPGIPIFESADLINWRQIGHVLTREEQLPLRGALSHGGIYAPTIRYHRGRFYVTATNVSGCGNFIVWTDDVAGEWSDVIPIDQDGIDPSLYFEDGGTLFMSNHNNADGTASIMQCGIDPLTGSKLSGTREVWKGCGGRYLESPHLYRINGWYYLMAAEGGTEYGHMVVLARGRTPYGPFENAPHNPVVSNRDLGGYTLQGTGHADLIEDDFGNWWMVLLAFRQIGTYLPFHHLGRETCLIPVSFTPDGWLYAGSAGTGHVFLRMATDRPVAASHQTMPAEYTFENTCPGKEWVWLRNPDMRNYEFTDSGRIYRLRSPLSGSLSSGLPSGSLSSVSPGGGLSERGSSPTFLGLRQQEMDGTICVDLHLCPYGEAGLTLYMDCDHHCDLALVRKDSCVSVIKRRVAGDMEYIQQEEPLPPDTLHVRLMIRATALEYHFQADVIRRGTSKCKPLDLGTAMTRYLSSEVAGGFTGVMIGLYAADTDGGWAEFSNFSYRPCRQSEQSNETDDL